MNAAVLVIDMQQGLCEGDGAAYDCEGTITRINRVTHKARAAGMPVIFIQHESKPGYLEYGSAAWQLADGLQVQATDICVRKTTPDSFLGTSLESVLRDRGVGSVVVCGMHSEFCVDTTARRALALGLPVVLMVRHLHPSMPAVSERLITFDAEAHDGVTTIGKGSHTRAPVALARFEAALAEPASRRCRDHGAC